MTEDRRSRSACPASLSPTNRRQCRDGNRRIVVVEPNGTGGMIHFAYQLCNALATAGNNVTLITSTDYEMHDRPHEFSVDARMRLWPLTDPAGIEPPTRFRQACRRMWRWSRRVIRGAILLREWTRLIIHLLVLKPDIVQFGMIHFPFEAAFLFVLRRCGLTLTQICHEFEERDLRWRLAKKVSGWLSQFTYANFERIFFLSEDTRNTFIAMFEYPRERTKVIKHGSQAVFEADAGVIERLRAQYGLHGDEPVVLFFGTLRPSKGVDLLVRAFATVRSTVAAKLLIVGYPTKRMDMASLKSSIDTLALRDAVILDTRYVPMEEVGAIQSLADIVVLPYRNATQSGALYLAYQFARPVVASKVGGLAEDVLHEKTGLLVPPEAPDDLAAALIRLIQDRRLAAKLGRQGQAFAEQQHAWPTIARDILAEYRAITTAGAVTESLPIAPDKSRNGKIREWREALRP